MAEHKKQSLKQSVKQDVEGATKQASDADAARWRMPYSRAEMEPGEATESVGNPYADDPTGQKRSGSRRRKG